MRIMKNIFFYLILILSCSFSIAEAQEISKQNPNLFSDYEAGKVLMKNKAIINASLNYDCVNKEMNYLENGQRMALQGLNTIDTIYIAGRTFIPYNTIFLEQIPVNQYILYIDWKTKVTDGGKKGAMGMISHTGTVEKLDVKRMQNEGVDNTGNSLYKLTPENVYYLRIDGKTRKFNSIKSFCKLFPKTLEKDIQSFFSKEKLDIQNPKDVEKLVEYISTQIN